uniref:Nuclear protein, coactivator of histone transcription n=1 Tax=Pavo cristatus TaxID=9049 RepID=A0A8C9FID5_PAVCR
MLLLLATCREFILESSDLKEYAEHCTEDGFIPACLLVSLCLLNKTTNEVPAMMSSLWKKLDYTLSQIRSGIVEMKRQRMLQQSAPPNPGLLSVAPQPGPQYPSSTVSPQQLIIENAREKILSNKSLQEKLAENINKILGSDGSVTQVPKQTESGPTEQETSIDEILGLQGEIHMSEEAIQDILEQTESDPAFQALFDLFDYGKNKVNKNLPAGISGQSGVENTILVDADNLETLESDNSREVLSCKGFQLEETSCALKNPINDDDMAKKNATSEQLHGNCRLRKEADVLKTITHEHIGELEIAFDSVPVLAESNKRQISDSECHEHCQDSYGKKDSSTLVPGNEKCMEIGKDTPSHSAQGSPNLEYVHSGSPQIPLVSLEEGCRTGESRTQPASKCHFSPHASIPEKTLTKSPSDGSPAHTALLRKNNTPISSPSADSGKEQAVTNDTAPLLNISQENLSHRTNQQDESVQSDCAAKSIVNVSDLDKTELQLEAAGTCKKTQSGDQHALDNPKKDFNLPSGLSNSEGAQVEMQETSSSAKADTDNMYFSSGDDACAGISVASTENNLTTSEMCHSPLPETASSTDELSTEAKSASGASSSSQPMDVDPSNIMSLKIIISDDPFISSDTELNNAVSSITGENLPTIILSSPAKSPSKTAGLSKCLTSEDTEKSAESALAEQNLLVLRPKDPVVTAVNTQNEDCTVFSVASTSNLSKEGGFIQLMPATSTAFGSTNNLYIATCVTDAAALGTAVTPSNVVVLPGSSMPLAAQAPAVQQLRTPPRSSSTFAGNQAVSPSFPQGSAIIITSPVQPVLQGMVGMIPLSVVGQNGNSFSAPARQVLHMPVANPVCSRNVPKLPIPPKSQKTPGARNKTNTGIHFVFVIISV